MAQFGNVPSLTELISRVIGKDEEAQWTLFHLFESQIYGYIRHQFEINRCVNPPQDSLDVANEVLFKALDRQKLKNLKNPAAFPGWLHTIAKRDVIAHLKQCTRNPPVELKDQASFERVGQIRTSEDILEASERIQKILIRAKSLDKRLYNILVLQLQGVSDEEIAERLGIAPNNVRTIRSRKLLKLRALLKETKE